MHLTDDPTRSTPADPAPSTGRVDHLTSGTFDEAIVTSDRPVLVDFTATWCPPCKQLTPVLHALAIEQADRLKIVEVDIDESPDLALRHQVLSAPTMVLYLDGQPVHTLVGARGRARLLEDLAPYLP
ncbi:MAG TPA: thioredoxin domain-containing protein [Acidimicrobiales bacterium]|nr:thioredoxin domain-containing protein [Acidimicrobiales bacterium]